MLLADILGIRPGEYLGLTVIAALVGAIASLLGLVLKEYFFSRSLESWKSRQALQRLYVRYRDPILLAASELCTRLREICERHPVSYLNRTFLQSRPEAMKTTTADDPYFQRYKLISSAYRLCSFFGWLELFRQEIVFLESGKLAVNRALQRRLDALRSDLADGQLNTADDWPDWHDRLIFREEQRAIGEAMITGIDGSPSIMGYAEFCKVIEGSTVHASGRWVDCALNFLLDPARTEKDFHLIRLKRLLVHLVELMEQLDSSRVSHKQKDWWREYRSVLGC